MDPLWGIICCRWVLLGRYKVFVISPWVESICVVISCMLSWVVILISIWPSIWLAKKLAPPHSYLLAFAEIGAVETVVTVLFNDNAKVTNLLVNSSPIVMCPVYLMWSCDVQVQSRIAGVLHNLSSDLLAVSSIRKAVSARLPTCCFEFEPRAMC